MNWTLKHFSTLTNEELYDLLKLRSEVFVVEQDCVYPDLDDLDTDLSVLHLFCYQEQKLVAYCRMLPAGLVYKEHCAIGRVVVAKSARTQNLGVELMNQALLTIDKTWHNPSCKISAQQHLVHFYNQLGFVEISEMYLEDGIPHVAMLRKAIN